MIPLYDWHNNEEMITTKTVADSAAFHDAAIALAEQFIAQANGGEYVLPVVHRATHEKRNFKFSKTFAGSVHFAEQLLNGSWAQDNSAPS